MSWSRVGPRRYQRGIARVDQIARVDRIQGDLDGRRSRCRVRRHHFQRLHRDRSRQHHRSFPKQLQAGTFAFERRLQQEPIAGHPRQGGLGDTSDVRQVFGRVHLRRRTELFASLARQPRRVDERLRVSRTVRVAERHDEDHASEQPVEKAPLHSTAAPPRQARDALSPRKGRYAGARHLRRR